MLRCNEVRVKSVLISNMGCTYAPFFSNIIDSFVYFDKFY